MKYLCLVYGEEEKVASMPDDDCLDYAGALHESGHLIAGEALEPVQTATTVRVRNGDLSITDGPFAETKEQLLGFYLIDACNQDEAIQIASGIPPACLGSIEVRPIRALVPQRNGAGGNGKNGNGRIENGRIENEVMRPHSIHER